MDPLTAVTIGSTLLGAFAGSQGTPNKNASSTQTTSMNLGPLTAAEIQGQNIFQQQLPGLTSGMTGIGSQQQFNQNYFNQASQYANMLGRYAQTGGAPTQEDIAAGQQWAQQQTAPLQQQMDLGFRQAREQYAQNAALQGRSANDFTFQNRLAQMRQDQLSQIGAQQQQLGSQYAQQLSQNRLGYMGQLTDLQSGLASQAMQNRMAIMSLGSQLQQQERQFRLSTASKTSTGGQTDYGQPGNLMGMLTGGFLGAKAGFGLAGAFGNNTTNDYSASSTGNKFGGFAQP